MMHMKNNMTMGLLRSFFVIAIMPGILFAVPVTWAKPGDQSFDDLRQQSSIAAAYNFNPVTADAGKGITVAVVFLGVFRSIEKRLEGRVASYPETRTLKKIPKLFYLAI